MDALQLNSSKVFIFPPIYAIDERWQGNAIQQLSHPTYSHKMKVEEYGKDGIQGYVFTPIESHTSSVLAINGKIDSPSVFDKVLRLKSDLTDANANDGTLDAQWERHPLLSTIPKPPLDHKQRVLEVVSSWRDTFFYKEEDQQRDVEGLRTPQVGAIHAVHAHWAVTDEPATIVMPTGTGKTETMLSVLITKRCPKLLVVVPTDPLRTQISEKFLSLGVLKSIGVVSEKALYPIVGVLRHRPKTCDELDEFFEKCNVVVTTMSIAGQCLPEVQERMAHHCQYLFIDEAHHIGARTWKGFRSHFQSKNILQFTATPYRNDGKPVDGEIIFNYPLGKAQKEDYFRKINFEPIMEFEPAKVDQAIAEKAVAQLREDRKKYDHILMARVGSVDRAKEVFAIYEQYSEFNPVQIHTGIRSKRKREEIRQQILSGESKIVVCVDMLGEGFDLPELKIAAFHDIRKSLAITLQLAGRFTRAKPGLGEATFIANIADVDVRDELDKLYRQDSDWNALLPLTSGEVIQDQIDLWKFIEGFKDFPKEIPLQNLRPAMSTVIYRTTCDDWRPSKFSKGIPGIAQCEQVLHDINLQGNTLVVVTARKAPIGWAGIQDIFNWAWELYILYWDDEQDLLFIHSSNNNGYYKGLAEAVAGEVELIKGPDVFRCLAGVNRLRLQNVGLIQQLGRLIRYTMSAGSDVEPALTQAQRRQAAKANIFGVGYENGEKTSIGCSYKGRIWSRQTTNVYTLTKWCSAVGQKVLDETIDPEKVLEGTLVAVPIRERPRKMPVAIEWPDRIYNAPETAFEFVVDGEHVLPLYRTDIRLKDPSEDGDLIFEVCSDSIAVAMVLTLDQQRKDGNYGFSVVGDHSILIRSGSSEVPLHEFFYENEPTIWFADGSSLEGDHYTELKKEFEPYPAAVIEVWDWTDVNIRKESQGVIKDPESIQRRVIEKLQSEDYDIIFDDDDSGEAADVVAVRSEEHALTVELYHCKFSKGDKPGARVLDLYEVCGQAQKSVHWADKPTDLFTHLLRREPKRKKAVEATRFEKGELNDMYKIREMSKTLPVQFKISIVQPGLSKADVSTEQLELLSVTENYLMETYQLPFRVIGSS